ncbi:MAG: amino acid permease [Acidobacteria bacterium]|nr:amino acid permease [Acidobacteriota bacterium]
MAGEAHGGLRREIGFWQATSLNVIDMVGIGPFVTLPLILHAMGGGQALWAWLLAALLAISDGLVTAELSAQLPKAGGSYAFLREAFGPATWGKLISFLFLFQVVFSAPLSIASGAIGFSKYLRFIVPDVPVGWEPFIASALCLLMTALLFRRIGSIGKFSIVLWAGVLLALGLVIGFGLPHLKPESFAFWRTELNPMAGAADTGLRVALLLAVYDYLGYYNVCYLAEEIKEPTKTIPRVIVVSILLVAVLYILMNVCVLAVLPASEAMTSSSTVSLYMERVAGRPLALFVTVLILWTAFASIFSLTLGYSRILWAAGRDGNFFSAFARLHPRDGYPYVALAALGLLASVFAFLDLKTVVRAIISIRAIIPFMAQIIAAFVLRTTRPDLERPFRMWLYPLPAVIALSLWGFVLFSPEKGFKMTGLVVVGAGLLVYLLRARSAAEWPFTPRASA